MKGNFEDDGKGSRSPAKTVSLVTLLLGFVALLVVVLLGLSALLGFQQFRDHLAERQQVQAQDAATALGLSLSNAVDGRDPAASATLINALFDHGDYHRVVYEDTRGEVLVEREAPASAGGVPGWFRSLASLPVSRGSAEVMQGWQRLGQVSVEVDPLEAYQALWRGTLRSALGFLLVGALALLLAMFGLRLILRPLGQLERHAELLRAHRFGARVPIPRTRELGSVAIAANHMARELEELIAGQIRLIEDLRRQNQQDPVTGLENRARFDMRLRTECDSHEQGGGGCLALLALTAFTEFNQSRGYQAGDALLATAAQSLREFAARLPGSFVGRRQGAEFGLFLPSATAAEARQWLEQLIADLAVELTASGADDVAVHVGFAGVRPPERSAEVLSRADNALAQARSRHIGSGVEGMTGAVVSHGGQHWQAVLTEALSRERLRLLFQPTFSRDGQARWFDQVLAQVEIDGDWVSASQFLPLVERYGLAVQLDRPVLRAALDHLRRHPRESLCVVISTASLADETFRRQTLATLAAAAGLSERLWIAIHEDAVRQEAPVLADLIPSLRELGVRVLIDRFGVGGVSFDYLQRWVIDGVRIDRSFVRHLDQRDDARFFIQGIRPIARSRKVYLFVAGVESPEEWQAAQALEVDGGMGYHLGRPAPHPSDSA